MNDQIAAPTRGENVTGDLATASAATCHSRDKVLKERTGESSTKESL